MLDSANACRSLDDANWSSSDGQRFRVAAGCSLAGFYPRYFGYYDQAISLYTHVCKDSVFGTQVISCKERESGFVLNGLLNNHSDLDPKIHCTDSHGYTEPIFALCLLLGYSFHPRLKGLSSQRIYKLPGNQNYGDIEPLFSGTINLNLIKANWEQILRVVYALKQGFVHKYYYSANRQ